MSLARKIIIYGVLVLIAGGLLVGSFYYYTRIKSTATDPINAIPGNTALFFEFHDPMKTIEHLQKGNKIWEALKGIRQFDSFAKQMALFDSLLTRHPDIRELLSGENVYISLHQDTSATPGYLIIVRLDPSMSIYEIHSLISSTCTGKCQIRGIPYGNVDIEHLFKDTTSIFSYVIYKGLFIGSVKDDLVTESIDQLRSGESISSDSFVKVQSTAGKKVDANIYTRFSSLNNLLRNAADESFQASILPLARLGQWMETDLIIKEDELLLNGYTDAIDSTAQYLNVFANQQAQKIEFPRILPYNTNFIISLGFESFEKFFERYREHLAHTGQNGWHDELLSALNKEFSNNFLNSVSRWIGNEAALVATGYPGAEQLIYSIIHIRDKDMASEYLARHSIGELVNYKDFKINRVYGNHSIPFIFGKAFQGVKQPFFIQIDNYFVFAENPVALEQYIDIYLSGKTLKRNENYQNFADNLSDKSNIFIYLNLRNSTAFIKNYLSRPLVELIDSNLKVFRNFEGVAAQFTLSNNMYYSSIYAKYNPSYVQEDLSIWKTILDSEIQRQPYFVKDHRTGTLKIIVFDTENEMYMIDHNGKILWKIPIGESVLSNVYPVDYYKNGKIQYLFNTANYIYLIDLLGRPVEGYPIRLTPAATNGIAVFDYEGSRNYRLLLAQEDNRIYNYDIKGLPIRGWKKPMAKETIIRPVEHVRMRNKDYLVVSDIDGNVMILNRRGRHRINLKEDYVQAANSSFYPNRTNSAKGIMLTTDQQGKLTYIQTSGRLAKTDFGEFTPGHYFLYEDFDNNGHKDFIYLDENELAVYDRFKQTIMQHTFKNEISSSPVIIPVSENRNIIGIVSGANRKVYLFDDEGRLISTPDMVGNTQILVGSLLNDGQLNLIVGSGRTLYNYYFQ